MERHKGSVGGGATRARLLATALAVALASGAGVAPARAAAPDPAAKPAAPPGKVILQWDHLDDSNDNTFEDFWGFVSYRQTHVQAWYGDFTKGGEIGGYLKDHRRSTYAGLYRYRQDFDHVVQFDTEQILKKGFVAAGMLRGIQVIPDPAPGDRNMIQVGAGIDYYHGDYNFLSVRAINDPREGGRWSFVTSHRFQREPSFYVQPGIILRTDGSAGWFLQGKYKLFRWGAGKYDRFDFTDVDRTTYSAGIEWNY